MMLMTLALGLRHGLDLDHIATIDSISRTARANQAISKMSGFLFSLGHGFVVTAISLIIGGGLIESHIPEWLEGFGNWISLFFLVLFGILNLWNVFQKTPSAIPGGIKSFLVWKIMNKKYNPALIMMIGALFAFSFDTLSQIALFSISATLMAGWIFSGILGLCFTLGMIITDGFNGLFVSAIIQRADRSSLLISRSLGLIISVFSLSVAIAAIVSICK